MIDELLDEPTGGAHRAPDLAARLVGEAIERHLSRLKGLAPSELVNRRIDKYMSMGVYSEE